MHVTRYVYNVGVPYVCLKDAITQPSCAARHMMEFADIMQSSGEQMPPLMLFKTDGGPDHNCNHVQVQLCWLALFIMLGIDNMIVMRCAPQQSWTSPVERCMGPLNLQLQNCALGRKRMDPQFEKIMKRCNGMAAVRAAIASAEAAEAEQMKVDAAAADGA